MSHLCVFYGSLRGGTTMIRLMMDAHPDLVCPGETDFLTDFLVPTPEGGWRYDLEAMGKGRTFRGSRARLPDTDEAGPAFRQMLADLRGDSEGCLVLVQHRGMERLLDLVPDIRVMHMLRDPRDVARSAIGMGWAGNVYYGVETWMRTERDWQRAAPRLREDQVLELRYETLVRAPEEQLERVCTFLGTSYDPDMLRYDGTTTYAAPDPSLAEQWRRKQTPRELGLVEQRLGPLLEQSGYAPSGHPLRQPGPAERLALRLENARGVWGHRFSRHGLRDPVQEWFGRKLGFGGLVDSARARMAVRTRKALK